MTASAAHTRARERVRDVTAPTLPGVRDIPALRLWKGVTASFVSNFVVVRCSPPHHRDCIPAVGTAPRFQSRRVSSRQKKKTTVPSQSHDERAWVACICLLEDLLQLRNVVAADQRFRHAHLRLKKPNSRAGHWLGWIGNVVRALSASMSEYGHLSSTRSPFNHRPGRVAK